MDDRILGIDPGTARVGYAVIDWTGRDSFCFVDAGIIQTDKLQRPGERLRIIREDLLHLIEMYRPTLIAVETIFFAKNAKTIVPVAQARGVILEAAAHNGLFAFEYSPMQVKQSVTGFGRADKKQVQETVAWILNQDQIIKPDDAADAVAVAICHARMSLVTRQIPVVLGS